MILNGGFNVIVDIPNAVCLSIQIGGSVLDAGTGTLSFTNASRLTVSGKVNIGPVNSNSTAGSLNMASGGTLTCEGFIVGRLDIWNAGTGTIEFTATNTIPSDNNVIFNNLTMSGGTTTQSGNLNVNGNILINSGATYNGGANQLSVAGTWTNNGTFTGSTGTVIFIKNGNQTITGTGVNNFNLIKVNLGTSINNTLEVLASNFSAAEGFLSIIIGTFKVSGTFALANSFMVGPAYNIQPGTGLWINNPNVTITAQAGGVSVKGLLRLTQGTYNIGTGIDNSLTYVAGSEITIEGGTLNIAGQLTRNNATATTSYTQSGGTVTVVEQGSTDPTFGGFDLGAVGSTFTMSGGTLVIRNATSAPADYVNASSVANVTGGTLQIGDAESANAQIIRIQSSRPVGNLMISNATVNAVKPTAMLVSSGLNVVGNITMQPGTILNANGFNISLGGDWSDSGAYASGGNTVTFNGSGAQSLSKTGSETFNNLAIIKTVGTLFLNSSVTVNNAFNLTQGTIAVGNNILTLNGTVSDGGNLTSGSTGTVVYNQSSAGQNVLISNYGNLEFSNFDKILASTGTIGISGIFTPGSATGHTVTGSTIDFNGGSQPIPVFPYNNVTTSGSGIKTGSGTITVSGNFVNNSGITFTVANTINLNGTAHLNSGTISAETISAGPGSILTNNGTITASSALSGSGSLVQGSNSTLNLGGITGITSLDASAAGNTTNYTGAAQTVKPVSYFHLTLSGTGTPILAGVTTINGNFTLAGTVAVVAATGINIIGNLLIAAGSSFNAGSFSHTVKGNLSNSGTFTPGTSTFTLNGTSAQTISGSEFNNLTIANDLGVVMLSDETVLGTLALSNGSFAIGAHTLTLNGLLTSGAGTLTGGSTSNIALGGSGGSTTLPGITLNNLTLNRASGVSLSADATINGILTIVNGTLNTGAHKVILGPAGTITEAKGQPVIGIVSITRNVSSISGTEVFGNIGAEITMNGIAPGNTSVLRKTGTASTGSGHTSVLRYFDITPTINAGLNAELVFHYDVTELNGQNAGALELYKSSDNGITWNNLGGTVNTTSGTVTVTGISDFVRLTAADTNNRIGNTVTPSTTNILPAAKFVGDAAFTLTVNGSGFVNGKSTVRFNGINKGTTFVNSTQLTASIPASDLLVVSSFPVVVYNAGGGGLSNAQTFGVNPLPPTTVSVETAADGTGIVVQAQSLASGSALKVYSVSRDFFNNFIANVAATSWALEAVAGGVVSGDLVPADDNKSAVFTGNLIGSADIKATSELLTPIPSGIITVTPGLAIKVRVETAADGSGTVVPTQSLLPGSSITLFSITRDASNNFVTNVSADSWNLQNITGGVVEADLVPAADNKSAIFTGNTSGSVDITAISGVLISESSGTITILSTDGLDESNQSSTNTLMQNFPNPFRYSTTINYKLVSEGRVTLKLFDMRGLEVATLVDQVETPGLKSVLFNAGSITGGIYYYRLEVGNHVETKKLLMLP